jgi:pimeloyl-ACP methyl ester carboxylesterase
MDRFARALELKRYALYLHDYGSQIGLRLAIKAPERVAALIIQNGDIYEDQLGPKYETLKAYWANPNAKGRQKLVDAVSEGGFRDEFVGEIDERLVHKIPPDLWKLSWGLMTPQRREIMVGLMEGLRENLAWFPKYQAYLREHRPPLTQGRVGARSIHHGLQASQHALPLCSTCFRKLVPRIGGPPELLEFLKGHWRALVRLDDVLGNFLGRR